MVRKTRWTTRRGVVRVIRLYRSWKNLNARVQGLNAAGNGSRPWAGLPNNFESWAAFREWALANGYSKVRNSLDRVDPNNGYAPSNCQWLSVSENTLKQNEDARREAMLHPDGVVSNNWTEEQRAMGTPF